MNSKALLVGNSDGIGLAVTRRLLAAGWDVTGISRSVSPILDPAYRHTVADVTSPEFPAVLGVVVAASPPDLCVYCAGIGDRINPRDLGPDIATFEVNLMGMLKTAAAVIPGMVERHGGHFIGISSLADELNNQNSPAYSGSKAGFSRYLGGLALAVRRRGVRVTNVRFGFVKTKMSGGRHLPMLMSADRAAAHVMKCVARKPFCHTAPLAMIPLVKLTRIITFIKRVLGL